MGATPYWDLFQNDVEQLAGEGMPMTLKEGHCNILYIHRIHLHEHSAHGGS